MPCNKQDAAVLLGNLPEDEKAAVATIRPVVQPGGQCAIAKA